MLDILGTINVKSELSVTLRYPSSAQDFTRSLEF